MTTIICATRRVDLDPVTVNRVLDAAIGQIYTTFDTYFNFDDKIVINRPKTFLINMIIGGVIDKVIQIGYNGTKCELVHEAEAEGVDVILFKDMT